MLEGVLLASNGLKPGVWLILLQTTEEQMAPDHRNLAPSLPQLTLQALPAAASSSGVTERTSFQNPRVAVLPGTHLPCKS